MDDSLQPSGKAILLEQYHQHRGKHVERVSPKDAFDVQLSDAQTRHHKASLLYGRESTVVMGSGGNVATNPNYNDCRLAWKRIEELEGIKATMEQEESEYQHRLEQEQADGLLEHLDILGIPLCSKVFTQWLAAQRAPPTPTKDQVGDEDQSTYMDLEFSPIRADAQQPPAAALPVMKNPPVTEQGYHPDMSTSDPQRPTEITTTVQDEAQETRPNPGPSRITRMAHGGIQKSLAKTSIEFEQVYQGGNAPRKYVISKFNDRWYIFECKKHKKQFRTANPIQGAWKHLRSRKHYSDSYGVNYHMAVVELGTEVLHCDDDKAKLNNKRAIIYKARKTNNPQNMDDILPTRASQSSSTMTTHRSHVSDIWPQLGEVYKTFWKSEQKFYAVLILPLDMNLNFSHLVSDWDTSLKHTPLRPRLPSCYVQSEDGRLEFTEDHKPGGSKETKRKYPVVYFHKTRFPSECDLDWIYVSNLEPYDPSDDSIEHRHRQLVNEYLSNYGNAENAGIEGANDVAEPTAGSLGPETFHVCLPTPHHSSPAAEQSDFSRDNSPLNYDDDIEFERSLTARTRENSSRVKEEVVQPSPMDMSGVPIRNKEVGASEEPAMLSQEEQNDQASDIRPDLEQHGSYMDVDSYAESVNDDSMTTPEERRTHECYRDILNDMPPQSSTTPLRDPLRPQAEVANMSVDTQGGISSTEVPISYEVVANPVL
ncbi:hypothetical protein FVEN_g5977 [Fusarium venenatum]|uniref:Uncharacterized protein n=1 Tax=Fusarium venenatum TaxID=56646 RepID=A0A2L2T1I1_9HYPO|nr:uncharacterized protein FVRRES_05739 [Fusarium venenatum]KAG8356235.1 hypothetical protein FVEN_g5977 [Fusarium venenatum]KAH6992790.1 hypothetical protein EDB82DRAFT_554823 [Fusarium venenatum]CEI61303.1 unnamed protein product [Fusarium venenatum]